MWHFACKIFLLALILLACNPEQKADNQLVVRVSKVTLRAEPSEKSRELTTLSKNAALVDLGEVSPFESQISLGGQLYQTPWIKVQTKKEEIGWIPAWALSPASKAADWLLQKRLLCYFGKDLTAQRNVLFQAFENTETSAQWRDNWLKSRLLRDTFLGMLARRPEQGFKPQFKWLGDVLPGYIYQEIDPGARPGLFANFATWRPNALKSNGLQDDAFLACYLAAFPVDSIESAFPVWKFPLSETEPVSQLGAGQHLNMFRQIDAALQAGPLFGPELQVLKDQILEDIFWEGNRYWQSAEKIIHGCVRRRTRGSCPVPTRWRTSKTARCRERRARP